DMGRRLEGFGVVQRSDGHVQLLGFLGGKKGEGRAAVGAEAPDAIGPMNLPGLAARKAEVRAFERSPGHERSPAGAPAIFAMAVGDVIGPASGFVTHLAAQTTAGERLRTHQAKLSTRWLWGQCDISETSRAGMG